jgi:hypothetical protein
VAIKSYDFISHSNIDRRLQLFYHYSLDFPEGVTLSEQSTLKCEFCGETILSGRFRELYRHILEKHPDAVINGTHCHLCQKMIPYGLSSGHRLFEHNIKSPGEGDSLDDLRQDYLVLQKLKERKIGIVEPKRRFPLG